MTGIEAKNAELAAGKPGFSHLDSNSVPANIFMTSYSDVP
jgi:hypothetical protein